MGEGLPDDVPRNYVPVPGVVQSKAFDHVPENIRKDAEEAVRCYAVGAWRASAAMARRAIQATAYAKGAPKKRLIDQIDWLANEGLITTQMKDVAHHVRLGGNLGAHPDSDGIKDVEHADAERVLLFLEQFFTYVYTIPAQLDQVGGESS